MKALRSWTRLPFREAVKSENLLLIQDNVALGNITAKELASRKHKMFEIRVAAKLRTLTVQYETDWLCIVGDFCKASDVDYKPTFQLARG